MSVLIKGMEMPDGCWYCDFCFQDMDSERNEWIRCAALEQREIVPSKTERHPDCPLIEVPPHGRLIDADIITEKFITMANDKWNQNASCSWADAYADAATDISDAPTIIPADKDGET